MPRETRWFIKTAIVYLFVALLLGVLTAVADATGTSSAIPALRPALLHLITVGWLTQMIFGVAYWMFPRHSKEEPRGSQTFAVITYVTLNAGLLIRLIAEPLNAAETSAFLAGLLVLSATLQWIAGAVFVVNTWDRVKEK